MSYVRFVKDQKIYQELLFDRKFDADAKGEILKEFYYEKLIPLKNILSVVANGALVIKDPIAHLKTKIPDPLAEGCAIHQQYLIARNLSTWLLQSLLHAIKVINKI